MMAAEWFEHRALLQQGKAIFSYENQALEQATVSILCDALLAFSPFCHSLDKLRKSSFCQTRN